MARRLFGGFVWRVFHSRFGMINSSPLLMHSLDTLLKFPQQLLIWPKVCSKSKFRKRERGPFRNHFKIFWWEARIFSSFEVPLRASFLNILLKTRIICMAHLFKFYILFMVTVMSIKGWRRENMFIIFLPWLTGMRVPMHLMNYVPHITILSHFGVVL